MGPAHTGDEAAAEVARVKATVDAAMTGMAGSKNAGKVIGVDGWNGIAMTGDKMGPAHTGDEAAAEVARVKATVDAAMTGMAGSKNAGKVIGVDGWNGIAMT